jgi:glutaredoxin 3
VNRPLERGKMEPKVIIYGTETCPFVKKAREAYGDKAISYNVKADPEKLQEMLVYSKGEQRVPVIVEGEKVTIGYGGT